MRRHIVSVLASLAVILPPLNADAQLPKGNLTSEGKPPATVPAFAAVIDHPDPFVRLDAVRGLCQVKPKSGQVVRLLLHASTDKFPLAAEDAQKCLWAMGPADKAAIPVLIETLASDSPKLRLSAAALFRGNTGQWSPEVREAIPALRIAVRDDDPMVSGNAAEALGNLGEEPDESPPIPWETLAGEAELSSTVQGLITVLGSPQPFARRNAADRLGTGGAKAVAAVTALAAVLAGDTDRLVRKKAAVALGRIGGDDATRAAALIVGLKDREISVREGAVVSLGKIGPQEAAVIPALIKVAESDPAHGPQTEAAKALGGMGTKAADAAPALAKLLTRAIDIFSRQEAARALGRVGPRDEASIRALAKALDDRQPEVREEAARVLAGIGNTDVVAIESLRTVLNAEGPERKKKVLAVVSPRVKALVESGGAPAAEGRGHLLSLRPEEPGVLEKLTGALVHRDPAVRAEAMQALGGFGTRASGAVEAIARGLGDADERVRREAALALGHVGPAAAPTLPKLLGATKDPAAPVRRSAAASIRVILGFRKGAPPPVDALAAALDDADATVRGETVLALGKIGPTATTQLVRGLHDREESVRLKTVTALGWFGRHPGEVAARALGAALRDPSKEVRLAAAKVLVALGSEAAAALADLEAAMNDADALVRSQAIQALAGIGAPALPVLLGSLKSPERTVRGRIAEVLASLNSPEAIPPLEALATNFAEDPWVRNEARRAAAALEAKLSAPQSPGAGEVPLLLDSLEKPTLNASELAFLAKFGPASRAQAETARHQERLAGVAGRVRLIGPSAVPPLVEAARSAQPSRRGAAVNLLGLFLLRSEEAARAVEAAAGDEDAAVRREVYAALGKTKGTRSGAPPILLAAVRREDEVGRRAAIEALGAIRAPDAAAVAVVAAASADPDPLVAQSAVRALEWTVSVHPEAAPLVLDGLLRSLGPEGILRRPAVSLLSHLGPPAVPHLVRGLQSPTPEIVGGLRDLGPAAAAGATGLASLLKGSDTELRREAARALAEIGPGATAAVPALIEALRDERSPERIEVVGALGRISPADPVVIAALLPVANTGYGGAQPAAALGLERAGAPAAAPLAEKIRESDKPDQSPLNAVLAAIGKRHPAAVAMAQEMLRDSRAGVRSAGVSVLGKIAAGDPSAVPAIAAALRDRDTTVRKAAYVALGGLGPAAAPAVQALIPLLESETDSAAHVLGAIGPEAAPAVPELVRVLGNRRQAGGTIIEALGRIGSAAAASAPQLTAILETDEPSLRQSVSKALLGITPGAGAAAEVYVRESLTRPPPVSPREAFVPGGSEGAMVPALARALDTERAETKRFVVHVLGEIGDAATMAVPALIRLLENDADRVVPGAVVQALAKIGPGAVYAVPALGDLLLGGEDAIQSFAAEALGRIAADPARAVQALRESLQSPNGITRGKAVEALGAFGPAAESAIPELFAELRAGNTRAAGAIARVGAGNEEVLRRLHQLAASGDTALELGAAAAILSLRPGDGDALRVLESGLTASLEPGSVQAAYEIAGEQGASVLLAALKDPDVWKRSQATTLLRIFAGKTQSPIPALVRALRDPSPAVQLAAARSLGESGPAAAAAIPALREILSDWHVDLRREARNALRKIEGNDSPG